MTNTICHLGDTSEAVVGGNTFYASIKNCATDSIAANPWGCAPQLVKASQDGVNLMMEEGESKNPAVLYSGMEDVFGNPTLIGASRKSNRPTQLLGGVL